MYILRLIFFFLYLISAFPALARENCLPFSLTVLVPKSIHIKRLYLNYRLNNGLYILDSATLHKGEFVFRGCIENPLLAELHKTDPNKFPDSSFSFFIDPGNSKIIIGKSFFDNPFFIGSPTSVIWHKYQEIDKELNAKLISEYKFTEDQLYDSDTSFNHRLLIQNTFIKKNSKSFASLELFQFFLSFRGKTIKYFSLLQDNYKCLDQELLKSEPGRKVAETMQKINDIVKGGIIPDFVLKLSDSTWFKSNEIRGKILIDFWASWCIPCKEDFPFLQKLRKETDNDSLYILSISIDDSTKEWRNAIEKNQLYVWSHVFANDKANSYLINKLFYYPVVPVKILLDRDKKVLGWWRGRDPKYDEEILKLIGKK